MVSAVARGIFYCVIICYVSAFDLTLVSESSGTSVVQACIAKIDDASIFSSDEQLLRRIAYVETHDGNDSNTYTGSNNNGGIWQLSSAKYSTTKTSALLSSSLLQSVSSKFGITWSSTSWSDLRKPFYSAIAARLYLEVISASIPLSTNINGQASYWASYYTSSGGSASEFVTAVNYLNDNEQCEVSGLDMIFVMDASGSVGSSNFQTMKTFVYNIVNSFDVGLDSVRVGVMSYGSSYTFHFYLNTYSSKSSILSAINSLPYSGGGTDTASALNAVRTIGFTTSKGARPLSNGVPRIAIVITDGKSNSYSATVSAATSMHNAGIIGFAIGIAGANVNELNAIASKSAYVAFISSFDSNLLSNLQVSLSQEACVASPDLSVDDEVTDTLTSGETKYVNYPLPADDSGITVQLNITNGSCTLYASTVVQTPNEALHDVKFTTDGWEDAYIDPNDLSNPDTADKVYIAIKTDESSSIKLSVDKGDTSTEPVSVAISQSIVSDYYGATVSVHCFATGKPQPTVNWYKDGSLLSSSGQISIVQTVINSTNVKKVLAISSLITNHEGTYICTGSNTLPNGTVSHSKSVSVSVEGIIAVNFTGIALSATAIYLSWDVPVVSGIVISHYVVECDELETDRDWSFFAVETHANIISLHPYYSYSCRIQIVGNETYPFNSPITVYTHQAAPSVAPQNPSSTFFAGSSTSLNLTWYPPPIEDRNGIVLYYIIVITELETGAQFEFSSNFTFIYLDSLHAYYSYTFQIAAVTISQGPFSNRFMVLMPEDAPSSPPRNLSIIIEGPSSITLDWLPPPLDGKNGIIRSYDIFISEVVTGNKYNETTQNTTISIKYLHPNYEYNITVRAVTILSGKTSDAITILTPEDIPSGSPGMFNATADSPYSAILTWDPPPLDQQNGVITGYVIDVIVLETNDTFLLYTNKTYLVVDVLRPFRTYVCIIAAQTAVGTGTFGPKFVLRTPQDAPSAPPLPTTLSLSVTSTSFYINWDPPDFYNQNGIITHYKIVITEIETGSISQHTAYGASITVTSLHPAYTYEFTVAAYTVGLGPFSSPFNITTAEEVPSASPQHFTGSSFSSSSITLTWDPPPPDQQNGVIISYFISITLLETGETFNYTSSYTTFTFGDLIPFTAYACIVAAETSIGTGPYTVSITITTQEDAPNVAPEITTSYAIDSSTVAIHWDPLPEEDRNGVIREYEVFIYNVNTGKNQTVVFTTTTAIIGSLTPSFSYNFFVSAVTVAKGPYSTIINITMPEDVPSGFPQAVSGNLSSPNAILLLWSAPSDDEQNGQIIQYVVNVTHADTLDTTQYFTTITHIYISGLDPYTTYVCVVAAQTSVGVGPFSHLYFIQTQEDAPESAPLHASGIALGPTSIHITWDPPTVEDHNGVIREYRVNVTQSDSQYLTQETTNQTQIVIDNLKPYTVYHCYVVAVTVDEGPYTDAISVITDEAAPSASPQSISVDVLDSTTIAISWSPPPSSKRNGIIRKYSIEIFTNNNKILTFTTGSTSFNTSVLNPYTTYSIRVAAFTVETGVYSELYNVTTLQDVPSSPPEKFNATAQGPTSLLLIWFPPKSSDINGIIQYYNVSTLELETGTHSHFTITLTTTTLENLHPFYTYKCSVSAVTIGAGPISVVTIKMPESAPNIAPENVVSSGITSITLDLSWDVLPPAYQNGIVRYYLINITEKDTGSAFQLSAQSNSIFIQDLHPFYTYFVSVAAFTVDVGPYSTAISYRTEEDVPSSSPTDLAATVYSSTEIYLSWSPPPKSERNGVIIEYNISVISTNSEEHITTIATNISIGSLLPYTTYQCAIAASTSVGQGPFTTYLYFETNEAAPISPPEHLSAEEISSTEIVVSWTKPPASDHNGIIRKYDIKLRENKTNSVTMYSTSDTEITIASLHPYYVYEVSVAAVTIDTGPFSPVLIVTTDEAAPSAAPTSLSVLASDSTTLNITWEPLPTDQTNGVIDYYAIRIRESDTAKEFNYETSETQLILSEHHPYYTYTVYVAAFTVSLGPYSAGRTVKMPADIPSGPPQNVSGFVISSTKIQLSWEPPVSELQNGPVQSYTITVFETNTNLTTQEHQDFLHSTITLTGLHPNYQYDLSVAAYTVGLGPSVSLTLTTLEDAPEKAPTEFFAVLESNSTVYLSWVSPAAEDINGVLLGYHVSCSAPSQHNFSVNISGTGATIHELDGSTHYSCYVCAYTSVGCGPNAVTHISTYEGSPVGPPSSVLTNASATTIELEWTAPFDPYFLITEYGIIYQLIGSSFQVEIPRPPITLTTATTETSYTIGSLLANSVYKVILFAILKKGTGPISEEIIVETKEKDAYSVQDYKCISVSSEQLLCSWSDPDTPNGYEVSQYKLKYQLADGFDYYPGYGTELGKVILPPGEKEYAVEGLLPYGGYIVELTCIISAIEGSNLSMTVNNETNEIISISTILNITQSIASDEPIKEMLVEVKSAKSVEVSWKPPPRIEWKGRINSYHITMTRSLPNNKLSKREANPFIETKIVTPQENHPDPSLAIEPLKTEFYIIHNLEESFKYSFSVGMMNSGGLGASSIPIIQTMPEAAPSGSPENITVVDVTISSITASWNPPNPFAANGIIVMYSLKFTRVDIQDSIEVQLPHDALYYSKKGLHVFENVSVSVAAKTAEGWGPYSQLHFFTTLEDKPSNPTYLSTNVVNGNDVLLSWNPPSSPNGLLIDYQVIYTGHERTLVVSDGPFVLVVNATEKMEITISDLVEGYFYEFKVRARNGAGYGSNSTAFISITYSTDATVSTRDSLESGELEKSTIGTIAGVATLGIIVIIMFLLAIICIFKHKWNRKKSITTNELPKFPQKDSHQPHMNRTLELPLETFAVSNPLAATTENDYQTVTFTGNETKEMTDLKKSIDKGEESEQREESEESEENDISGSTKDKGSYENELNFM